MSNPESGPVLLVQTLLSRFQLKNCAALAHELKVAPPVISKWLHGRLIIGEAYILRIHETFDMPVAEIRALAGIPRA